MRRTLLFLFLLGCSSTPQAPPIVDFPAVDAEVGTSCSERIARARRILGEILAVKGDRTEANLLEPWNLLMLELDEALSVAYTVSNVHPDPEVRGRAEAAVTEAGRFQTELNLNRDLYEAFTRVDLARLDPAGRRLVKRVLRDFRRAGVDKNDATRARIRALQEELIALGQEFGRNINTDVRWIDVDPKELAGLPEDFLASHPPGGNGKVRITTRYPDLFPVMQYGTNVQVRKDLHFANGTRGYPENERVLKRMLEARHELARLLGYPSWAAYVTEDKMIGTAEHAETFIREIADAAKARGGRETAQLLELKRKEDPRAEALEGWESWYYETKLLREKYAFDAQSVRPYFEYGRVKRGLMELMEHLFDVRFEAAKDAKVWHPSVEAFRVRDGDGSLLGWAILDMHPRDGKYTHAAQFSLRAGAGGRQLPVGVLVCNLPEAGSLLEAGDVSTFFHEFGHLMHHLLGGRQKWYPFAGVATEWDFVEAPSQLLEEWVRDPAVLRRFAKHHQTGEPIPEDLVRRMRRADEFGKGMTNRRQMCLAMMSLRLHQSDPSKFDILELVTSVCRELNPTPFREGTHPHLSFGHLDGYSAIYYTYAWSFVIAKDLFAPFEKNGLLDRATAMKYRRAILEPGGSRDAADLVKDFLGRAYSSDAFRRWLESGE